jgi:hypothetical protein
MSSAAPTRGDPVLLGVSRSTIVIAALLGATPCLAIDRVLHVAPGGSDSAAGAADSPLATLGEALERVARETPGGRHTIRLAGSLGERTPLDLPGTVERLRIAGPDDGLAALAGAGGEALLRLRSAGPLPGAPVYEIAGLSFNDGQRGISIEVPQGAKATVSILRCEFHRQKLQAIELVAGEFAELEVSIADCVVTGSPLFAIDIGTRESAAVALEVVRNRVESLLPAGEAAAILPRSGIAVYADDEVAIRGRVSENTLVDAGDGIVIATTDHLGKAGEIVLDVAGNIAYGSAAAPRSGLQHGIVLSLLAAHDARIRILHNTLVGGTGHGLSVRTAGRSDDCAGKEVEVAGNVVLAFGRGATGTAWMPSGPADPPPPLPACVRVWGNAGDGANWDGAAHNVRAGAGDLVDLPARDLRPRLGSRLVDYPPVEKLGTELGARDAHGGCRVTDGDGDGVFGIDVGAVELAGGAPCVEALLEFARGDCNGDDRVDVSDSVRVFSHLFRAGVEVRCGDACDGNDDAALNVSDGIYLLNYLFLSGPKPPPPFPEAGVDPTPDAVVCLLPART